MDKNKHLNKWHTYNLNKKMINDMCSSLGITKDQLTLLGIDEIEKLIEKRNDKRIVLSKNLFDKIIRNTICKLGWHIEYVLLFDYINVSKHKCIYCGKHIIIENENTLIERDYE